MKLGRNERRGNMRTSKITRRIVIGRDNETRSRRGFHVSAIPAGLCSRVSFNGEELRDRCTKVCKYRNEFHERKLLGRCIISDSLLHGDIKNNNFRPFTIYNLAKVNGTSSI